MNSINQEKNPWITHQDDFDTYSDYAIDRVSMMLRLQAMAKRHLLERPSALQQMVYDMACHKVTQAEQRFGISRQDYRVKRLMASV